MQRRRVVLPINHPVRMISAGRQYRVNTSSGGAVPRPLLDGFFSALNPVLPQGAALSALRGVQYFGDRGLGTGLLCLTIWAATGLVLLGVAGLRASHHRPAVISAPAMATT